jgi:uncharacterized protein YdiU (UPF0061 family)
VAHWNLLQLANALALLFDDPAPLQAGLDRFVTVYDSGYRSMLADRLGWDEPHDGDDVLVTDLFGLLQRTEVDQVVFHRDLARVPVAEADDDELLAPLADAWYRPENIAGDLRAAFVSWLRAWGARAVGGGLSDDERRRRMDAVNPRFVLRNYLAQEAIDAAEQGDPSLVHELLDVLRRPYEEQPGRERFAAKRPEWARHRVGCSMLSCSS